MTSAVYSIVILAALTVPARAVFSQSAAAIPLWPCYSVHKLPNTTDTFEFRYVGVTDCDCVFTLEGPAGSKLNLQLHDVFLEPPTAPPYGGGYGYGYGYRPGYVDCSRGAVKIFNFATSGALTVSDTVCNTLQSSGTVTTDTNMAVITSTFHRGQFLLRVNITLPPADNIAELVPPSVFASTTRTPPETMPMTTATPVVTSTVATPSTAFSAAVLANLVRTTEPAPPTTSTSTTTTTRRPVPEKLVQTSTTRTPEPTTIKRTTSTTTTAPPTITPTTAVRITIEPTTERVHQERPSTMVVQAEFLVQEKDDVSPTNGQTVDTVYPESSETDSGTTESTTELSEDIQSNLV